MRFNWWDNSFLAIEEREAERKRKAEDSKLCKEAIARHKKMMERREFLKKHEKVTVSVRKNFIIKKEEVDEEPIKTERYRAKNQSLCVNPPINRKRIKEIKEIEKKNFSPLKGRVDHSLTK